MPITDTEIKTIITDAEGMQTLVKKAEELAKELKTNGMTTSQIRALFGEMRQIEAEWGLKSQRQAAFRRLVLFQPKMAYRARSERGQAVKMLVEVLDKAVKQVVNAPLEKRDEYFKHFVEFFEAILAYHKAFGGK
jgi:CRISPR-associated protein Csm2